MEWKYGYKLCLLWSVLTAFGFCILAFMVSHKHIEPFDSTIITFIQSFETPVLTSIMLFFTDIGSGSSIHVFSFVVFILFYFVLKYRFELLLFIVVLLGSHYLFRAIKHIFERARPDTHRLIEIGGYSFPSGHATNAICIYGVLTFVLWSHIPSRIGRYFLLSFSSFIILAIGVSRIYLGVHYPSDILAGYFVGGFWLTLAIYIFQMVRVKWMGKTHENYTHV